MLEIFVIITLTPCTLCLIAMDISADLTELGRTPITVVSAGVKSILDIGRTLEYLVILEPICQNWNY